MSQSDREAGRTHARIYRPPFEWPDIRAEAERPLAHELLARFRMDLVLKYLDRLVPRALFHLDVFFVTELKEPVRLRRPLTDFTVREASGRDIDCLVRLFGRERGQFDRRREKGHIAFACETRGSLIGMSWVNPGREHTEPEKFCRFALPPDGAWGYDLFVLPDWQLSPAAMAILIHAFEHARSQGRARVFGFASRHNTASLRAHLSFGHRKILQVTVFNLLGLRVHRVRYLNDSGGAAVKVNLFSSPVIDLIGSTPRS